MTNILPFRVSPGILLKRVKREAVREAQKLYQDSGGFGCLIPTTDPEIRRMWEEGEIEEIPWE